MANIQLTRIKYTTIHILIKKDSFVMKEIPLKGLGKSVEIPEFQEDSAYSDEKVKVPETIQTEIILSKPLKTIGRKVVDRLVVSTLIDWKGRNFNAQENYKMILGSTGTFGETRVFGSKKGTWIHPKREFQEIPRLLKIAPDMLHEKSPKEALMWHVEVCNRIFSNF